MPDPTPELTTATMRRNRNWLPPSAATGIAVAIVVVVVMAALSYLALAGREEAAAHAGRSADVGRRLEAVLSALKDAETSQRGYLLTGADSYLEPYRAARAALPVDLKRLRELLAGDADQLREVDRAAQLIADKIDELEQTIVLRSAGNTDGALAVVRTDRGRVLMDGVRAVAGSLRDRANADRLESLRERDAAAQMSFVVTSVGSALLLGFIVWSALLLSRGFRQREAETWVRSGISRLAISLQGDQGIDALGQAALVTLCGWLDAPVGALFVRSAAGRFERVASYGTAADAGADRPADGLLAQAASEARVLHVRDVPAGYLTLASSLGQGDARELLIVPAAVDGVVHAVFEAGLLRHVDDADRDFAERISSVLAVAVRSAGDRSRLESLLAETQRQSEALQTQQEELRVNNEELEEQSRALKESQGRLESSQAELEANNSQLEEQAQLLEDQRDNLVRSQQDLSEKAVELERSSQYKSEFLANMSHELRTPLNSTLILAKLLADNRDGNLSAEQVKFAETISSAGNDLLTLINDILDLSRIEAGKFEVVAEPVHLARTLETLSHTFTPMARQKGLGFTTTVDAGTPEKIETDPQRLGQILKNLIANAIKFTAGGEVAVRVFEPAEGHVAFAVRDTGIGIAPSQHDLVFDAFRQASGGTNRKYGGSGLGLTISRDLARLLGGDIELDSREGAGSTFTLTLPAVYAGQAEPADEEAAAPVTAKASPFAASGASRVSRPPAASGRGGATPARTTARAAPPAPAARDDDRERLRTDQRLILVIEDDPHFARILCDLAHELHFQCVIAHSASEGIEAAVEFEPSAIVLDMQLPDHSGLGVLDQLKRNPRTRHIPVHVASAADYSHEALELGAIGYALKPVTRDDLVGAFRSLEARFTRHGAGRILIVEDDPRQRESLVQLLGNEGVEIVTAGDAGEALAALKSRTFDCIVMDLNLPDLSGHDLLEQMAESDEHSFPPVIVYTGRSLSRDEEQKLRRYSKSIIVKGARSPERLLDEVTLFLHQVETELPAESQRMLRAARDREKVFEGRRILIVEDDVRNVFALTSVLEPKGAIIEIARNGLEGLKALERATVAGGESTIDLVLMDIMMPEMDGLTAMREIRKRPEWKRLPIVALTAKAMRDDQEKCLAAGANDYIAKPLDVEKLLSLVRVWLPK